MKITVIGAGYVGLVTAVCFADLGNEVLCAKKTESNMDILKKGISPIFEDGLTEMLKKMWKKDELILPQICKRQLIFRILFLFVLEPLKVKTVKQTYLK